MYLDPNSVKPRILAHRGLVQKMDGTVVDENTIEAFQEALDAGADYIETDIRVTKDEVAVVFHDEHLLVGGKQVAIRSLTYDELRNIPLPRGGRVPSLEEVLNHFPTVRFNIDFKSDQTVQPGAAAIVSARAESRVLLTCFSHARKHAIQKLLPSANYSLSPFQALVAWYLHACRLQRAINFVTKDSIAAQLPLSYKAKNLTRAKFVASLHKAKLEVHFWVVNDAATMLRLASVGSDGIVTDQTALAVRTLRNK